MAALLEFEKIVVDYSTAGGRIRAVDHVDLRIDSGTTVGLVGESGSGKSTLGRAIVGLAPFVANRFELEGSPVDHASNRDVMRLRKRVQMVFQDPYSSLNPRMTVGETLDEAVTTHFRLNATERSAEVGRLLEQVGLQPQDRVLYPFQFSGGQRQRIAIARALAVKPVMIIADEITSALDVSVQSTILNLLRAVQRTTHVSYLFISHNLAVVRYLADVIAVMHLGRIVEIGPAAEIFRSPKHPYTRALIDSLPRLHRRRAPQQGLEGDLPNPLFPPSGCRFHTRCPVGPQSLPERRVCRELDPALRDLGQSHEVACHFPLGCIELTGRPPGGDVRASAST